jgi:putative membrane protein
MASFHLLGLGLGLGAVFARARTLQRLHNPAQLAPVLLADNLWGVAALLWLVTGLWRVFGGLEKGTVYYLQQPLFHAKLGLFLLVLGLELWPMVSLMRWRVARRRGATTDFGRARLFAQISYIQVALVVVIIFLATALVRSDQTYDCTTA